MSKSEVELRKEKNQKKKKKHTEIEKPIEYWAVILL
jgi:hypothetical protein